MKTRLSIFQSVLLLTLLISCQDEPKLQVPSEGNYFPTSRGSHWTYEINLPCDWPNETSTCVSISESRAEGDELSWDDSYEPFSSATGSLQFVKIVDGEYYGYGYYIPEYKFLDDDQPKGSQWAYGGTPDDIVKEVYEIMEVNATKIVHGAIYTHVIVVNNTYMWRVSSGSAEFETVRTTTRWFAKNIGEIYSLDVYDYQGEIDIRESSLIDYSIK